MWHKHHGILAEMEYASRDGRANCLGCGGKGTGGRREQLTKPQDVNLHSRGCSDACSYWSPANSFLHLKTAPVYRHKDLPDCYPTMGCEVVGNLKAKWFILEKLLLPVARNPVWSLHCDFDVLSLVLRQFPTFCLLSITCLAQPGYCSLENSILQN